jgi:NAD(P)-dependent dehydrogenase (short-subunit alcohol dehydrogenase family)
VVHDAGVALDGSGYHPAVARAAADEIRGEGGVAEATDINVETRQSCEDLIAFVLGRFGRIDILIHNAAIISYEDIAQIEPALWERMTLVNVQAPFWLSRAALAKMRPEGDGRIVFTISGVAMYPEAAMPGLTAYAVGKGRSVRADERPDRGGRGHRNPHQCHLACGRHPNAPPPDSP